MPMLLTRFAPPALAGVVLAGVAAAIMSSVNSFLNVGAAALVRDLPNALGRPFSRELLWARVATVGLAVAATGVASWSGSAVAFLGIFGWGLFASTLVPALALGLNWRGATGAGATASIAIGLIVTLALETLSYTKVFTVPAGVTPAAIALTLSLGTMFAVSWFTRASAAAELDDDVAAVIDA
jgi:Na+/proline symporter